ncbi:unnamed protein product [Arabidopsis arenosa]|uniref:Replication protein A 70 kDa DNA-binding subunit B/D first OB fold domain-containing protein n=1 Tax=Arabidopsis arenosa TaxID=38785 RepID=A0A8S2AXY3_ARAAE|nr:unnamed protein product [Arabidopsis arenosa]
MRYRMFDDVSLLESSRTDWLIRVRVLNVWHHEERGLGTSLEVILSDSKGTKVQASFRGCAYHRSASKITPGDWFDFKDFKVVEQYGSCRATNHRYKIIVLYSTEIDMASVMRDDSFFDFVDFKKITDGVHSDDYLVDIIGQVIHVSDFPTWDRLDGYKKDDGTEDGDSLPKNFYLKRLINTCLKPPGDIVIKSVSTGSLDGYNSDDVDELTGDDDSDEESCTEDEGRVEDDPEYQIDNDEQDADTDEVNDRIASTDDDASEVSEDEYDFVDDYDECDDSDCAAESDDDFYEVEEDDYEYSVEDDEEDVDSEYSVVSESEEDNLDGCDGKPVEERKADKLDDYSVHHKISFDLRDSSNNVLKCELVGYEAVNFYKSFKKWQYDVIICVIRWGVVDVFQDKRTITATECTQIRLNPGIPEVAEFRTSPTDHRFMIHWKSTTWFRNIQPMSYDNFFAFASFEDIKSGSLDTNICVDLIGRVVAVGNRNEEGPPDNEWNEIFFDIENIEGDKLTCRLPKAYANDFFDHWRHSVDKIIICVMRFAKLEVDQENWRATTVHNCTSVLLNPPCSEVSQMESLFAETEDEFPW